MLQRLFLKILSQFLVHDHIDDHESGPSGQGDIPFSFRFMEGKLIVRECMVKQTVLDNIGFPFRVEKVAFKKLEIFAKWRWDYFSCPVAIEVDGVSVALTPHHEDGAKRLNLPEAQKAVLKSKRRRMDFMLNKHQNGNWSKTWWSSVWQLCKKFIKSLSVKILDTKLSFVDQFGLYDMPLSAFRLDVHEISAEDLLFVLEGSVADSVASFGKHVDHSRRNILIEGLKATVGYNTAMESNFPVLASSKLFMELLYDIDARIFTLQIKSAEEQLCSLTPSVVETFHKCFCIWKHYESWVKEKVLLRKLSEEFNTSGSALRGAKRFAWAARYILEKIRLRNKRKQSKGLAKEIYRYHLQAGHSSKSLDDFEFEWPLDLIFTWRKDICGDAGGNTKVVSILHRLKNWLYISHEDDVEQDHLQNNSERIYSDDGASILLLTTFLDCIRIDARNENDSSVFSAVGSISALLVDMNESTRLIVNVDDFEVNRFLESAAGNQENAKYPVVKARKKFSPRLDEGGFFCYSMNGDDDFFESSDGKRCFEQFLSSESSMRLHLFRSKVEPTISTSVSLTVEPLELYCLPIVITEIIAMARNIIRSDKIVFPLIETKIQSFSFKLKLGAPACFFLLDDANHPTRNDGKIMAKLCMECEQTCLNTLHGFGNSKDLFQFHLTGFRLLLLKQSDILGTRTLESQSLNEMCSLGGLFVPARQVFGPVGLGLELLYSRRQGWGPKIWQSHELSAKICYSPWVFEENRVCDIEVSKTLWDTVSCLFHRFESLNALLRESFDGGHAQKSISNGQPAGNTYEIEFDTSLNVEIPEIYLRLLDEDDNEIVDVYVASTDLKTRAVDGQIEGFHFQCSSFLFRGCRHSQVLLESDQFVMTFESSTTIWTISCAQPIKIIWDPETIAGFSSLHWIILVIAQVCSFLAHMRHENRYLDMYAGDKRGSLTKNDEDPDGLSIACYLAGLSILLRKDGNSFAGVNLRKIHVDIHFISQITTRLNFNLLDATVYQFLGGGKSVILVGSRQLSSERSVSLQDANFVTIDFSFFKNGFTGFAEEESQKAGISFLCQFCKAIELIWWEPFFLELVDYIWIGVVGILNLPGVTSSRNVDQDKSACNSEMLFYDELMSIEVKVKECLSIRIPRSLESRFPALSFDIEEVSAERNGKFIDLSLSDITLVLSENEAQSRILSRHDGFPLVFNLDGLENDEGKPPLELDDLAFEMDLKSICHVVDIIQKNIVINSKKMERIASRHALLVKQNNYLPTPRINYWSHFLAMRMEPVNISLLLRKISISVQDFDLTCEFSSVDLAASTSHIKDAGVKRHASLRISGIEVCFSSYCIVGSLPSTGDPGYFFQQLPRTVYATPRIEAEFGVVLIEEPLEDMADVAVTSDNICFWLSPKTVCSLNNCFDSIKHIVRASNSDVDSGVGASQIGNAFRIEISESKIFLGAFNAKRTDKQGYMEICFAAIGGLRHAALKSGTFSNEGKVDLELQCSFRRSEHLSNGYLTPPSYPLSNRVRKSASGASIDQDQIPLNGVGDKGFGNGQFMEMVLDRCAMQLLWTFPDGDSALTPQISLAQTSNLSCFISCQRLRYVNDIMNMFISAISSDKAVAKDTSKDLSSLSSSDTDDSRKFLVVFYEEPLGLKLGPYSKECSPILEVRGYGRRCEERITRLVRPGDTLISVNSNFIVGLTSLDEAKSVLRNASWPRAIVFERRLSRMTMKSCPLQYVPCTQTVWECQTCMSLQPLESHGRSASMRCFTCGTFHEPVTTDEKGHLLNIDLASVTRKPTTEKPPVLEVFENQRFFFFFGWLPTVMPDDPFPFSDESGRYQYPTESSSDSMESTKNLLMRDWIVDEEGWKYADDFSAFQILRNCDLIGKPDLQLATGIPSGKVRRRRWIRSSSKVNGENSSSSSFSMEGISSDVQDAEFDSSGLDGGHPDSQYIEQQNQYPVSFLLDTQEHRISFLFIDDYDGAPLLRLYVSHTDMAWARMTRMTDSVRTTGNLKASIDYFSLKSTVWEPLVEPWSIAGELLIYNSKSSLTILGLDEMKLNLSLPLFGIVNRLLKETEREFFSSGFMNNEPVDGLFLKPLTKFVNNSGVTVLCELKSSGSSKDVASGETIDLFTVEHLYRWDPLNDFITFTVFGGWNPLPEVPVRYSGTAGYELFDTDYIDTVSLIPKQNNPCVILRTSTEKDGRVIEIQSRYRVRNFTDLNLSLRLKQNDSERIRLLGMCTPNEFLFIPILKELETYSLQLCVRKERDEKLNEWESFCELNMSLQKSVMDECMSSNCPNGIVFERRRVSLTIGGWVCIQFRIISVERCFAASNDSSIAGKSILARKKQMTRKRSGFRSAAFILQIEIVTQLSVASTVQSQIFLRMRNASERDCVQVTNVVEESIQPGKRWHVNSIRDLFDYEWSLCIPRVNMNAERWSSWTSFKSTLENDGSTGLAVTLYDQFRNSIHITFRLVETDPSMFDLHPKKFCLIFSGTWVVKKFSSLSIQPGFGVLNGSGGLHSANRIVRPLPAQQSVEVIVVYEVQTWNTRESWTGRRFVFESDENVLLPELDEVQAGEGYCWAEPQWRIPSEGNKWQYGQTTDTKVWKLKKGTGSTVRRRKWIRTRVRISSSFSETMDTPSSVRDAEVFLLGALESHYPETMGKVGLSLRCGGGQWSKAIDIDMLVIGNSYPIALIDGSSSELHFLVISVNQAFEICIQHQFQVANQLQSENPSTEQKNRNRIFLKKFCSSQSLVDNNDMYFLSINPSESVSLTWPVNAKDSEELDESEYQSEKEDGEQNADVGPHCFCIGRRVDGESIFWTGPINPLLKEDSVVFMRRSDDMEREVIRVRITYLQTSLLTRVEVSECPIYPLMYRLENRSLFTIACRQVGKFANRLPPLILKNRRSCMLAYEDIMDTSQAKFILQVIPSELGERSDQSWESLFSNTDHRVIVDLFADSGRPAQKLHRSGISKDQEDQVEVRVFCDGVTKVISVTHSWAVVRASPLVAERVMRNFHLELCGGVVLSLINNSKELLCLHASSPVLRIVETDILQKYDVTVLDLQIDDPDPRSVVPVVLTPRRLKQSTSFIRGSLVLYKTREENFVLGLDLRKLLRIRNAQIAIGDFHIRLWRPFVVEVTAFLSNFGSCMPLAGSKENSYNVYIDCIEVHPIGFKLTLLPYNSTAFGQGRSGQKDCKSQSYPEAERRKNPVSLHEVVVSAMSRVMSLDEREYHELPYWAVAIDYLLRNELQNQRIRVGGLVVCHLELSKTGPSRLSNNPVADHFKIELGRELVGATIISSEMMQRPVNIARGFRRLFYLNESESSNQTPQRRQSIIDETIDLSESLMKGISRGLATMSMSNDYIQYRKNVAESTSIQKLAGASNETEEPLKKTVLKSLSAVKEGVSDGLTGLFTEPYQGARNLGASGFIGGLGKGVMGAAVKPFIGVLDGATIAAKAMKGGDDNAKNLEDTNEEYRLAYEEDGSTFRVRKPRPLVGKLARLARYCDRDSDSFELLCIANGGEFKDDEYRGHVYFEAPLGVNSQLYILTSKRVLCFRLERHPAETERRAQETYEFTWELSYENLQSFGVTQDSRGLRWGVYIRSTSTSLSADSEMSPDSHGSRFIWCGDEAVALDTYEALRDALQSS